MSCGSLRACTTVNIFTYAGPLITESKWAYQRVCAALKAFDELTMVESRLSENLLIFCIQYLTPWVFLNLMGSDNCEKQILIVLIRYEQKSIIDDIPLAWENGCFGIALIDRMSFNKLDKHASLHLMYLYNQQCCYFPEQLLKGKQTQHVLKRRSLTCT